MSRLEKYPSYKDSGVEWLGEIPEGWEITRLSTRFIERKEKVSDKDFEPLSVTKNGVVHQLDSAAKSNDGDNRKLVRNGDFVINSRSDRKGSSGVSFLDGSVSLINIVLNPINIDTTFCNYLLKGNGFIEEFYRNGHGIVADLWTTRYWDMKSIILAIPPKQEQTKIASFLDEKTTQIDEAISQKQKLIEFLKERKQIVINDAVTKGLDKNVEFVDSGVEWIGNIPKHWEVIKFKHLFYEKKKTYDISLNCGSISFGKVIEKSDEKIPVSTKASYQVLNKGEFLINPLNLNYDLKSLRIGLSDLDVVVSSGYIIIKNKENIDKTYFNWLLHRYDIAFMKTLGAGVRQTLNFRDIAETLLVNPPKHEQLQIVQYIETQTTKIDNAIDLQQNYIAKLKEYKSSLIDSVVTGKVRVV
jgi:type I restriction enzyme S subunit